MKKSFCIFNLLVLCLIASQVIAQAQTPIITLTGTGQVEVQPDEAELNFGINTRSPDIDQARGENDSKASDVIAILKTLGVEEEDIKTSYTSLQPYYPYNPQTGMMSETPSYYIAQKYMTVLIKNLDDYDQIMSGLYKAGVNQVNGISFTASNTEKAKLEAKRRAVRDAKRTATALVQALGTNLGPVYSISVNSYGGGPVYYANQGLSVAAADSVSSGNSGPSVAEGKITVNAEVSVSFMIQN